MGRFLSLVERRDIINTALSVSEPKMFTFSSRQELKLAECKKKCDFVPSREVPNAKGLLEQVARASKTGYRYREKSDAF